MLTFLAASYGLQQGKRAEMSSKLMLVRFISTLLCCLVIQSQTLHIQCCYSLWQLQKFSCLQSYETYFCEYYNHVGIVHWQVKRISCKSENMIYFIYAEFAYSHTTFHSQWGQYSHLYGLLFTLEANNKLLEVRLLSKCTSAS